MQGLRKVVVLLVGKRFIARVLLNYTTVKKGLTLCNYVSYCNFNVYFINSSGKWSISKGLDSNNDVAMIIRENVSTMKLFFFIAGYCFQNCQGIIQLSAIRSYPQVWRCTSIWPPLQYSFQVRLHLPL